MTKIEMISKFMDERKLTIDQIASMNYDKILRKIKNLDFSILFEDIENYHPQMVDIFFSNVYDSKDLCILITFDKNTEDIEELRIKIRGQEDTCEFLFKKNDEAIFLSLEKVIKFVSSNYQVSFQSLSISEILKSLGFNKV